MRKYIDLEDAIDIICGHYIPFRSVLIREFCDAASDDVMDVVKCKNCTYYRKDKEIAEGLGLEPDLFCPIHESEFDPDAFCSYGRTI